MNNKGQAVMVALMIGVVFIVLAMAFAPTLKIFSDNARNTTSETSVGLDCSNESISDWDKANCVATDSMMPYFVGFLIFAGGAIITAKILL